MEELKVQEKEIVVPGDVLAEGMGYLPSYGTYREGDKIFASKIGLVQINGRAIKLVSLSGKYLPKRGDVVIAKVIDVSFNGWRVEMNCAYSALLSLKEATSEYIARGANLTQYFTFGDYLVTKIVAVSSQNLIDVSMRGPGLKKLSEGRIMEVSPNKVPRIIGSKGSMISMIKNATGCRIVVGQNGLVWMQGEPKSEVIATEAIKKIEAESHISGLTDRIKEFLEKKLGRPVEIVKEGESDVIV